MEMTLEEVEVLSQFVSPAVAEILLLKQINQSLIQNSDIIISSVLVFLCYQATVSLSQLHPPTLSVITSSLNLKFSTKVSYYRTLGS